MSASRASAPLDAADVRALFPDAVAVATAPIAELAGGALLPEEAALAARAVPRRVAELVAGRTLARRALAELGLPPSAILAAPDRSPIWPAGVSGSISHTAHTCAGVVGATRAVGYLGLDVEDTSELPEGTSAEILRPRERARAALAADARAAALLVFSAKEAFYKAQHPLTGVLLEFLDVELEGALDGSAGTLAVHLLRDAAPLRPGIVGAVRWRRTASGLVSAMTLATPR